MRQFSQNYFLKSQAEVQSFLIDLPPKNNPCDVSVELAPESPIPGCA